MEDLLIPIIIQVISGVVGSGIVGTILKQAAMAMLPKLLAGGIGGIAGGQLLGGVISGALGGDASSGMDIGNILGNVIAGAGGGGGLAAIAGTLLKGK